jgi:hypothetical protein
VFGLKSACDVSIYYGIINALDPSDALGSHIDLKNGNLRAAFYDSYAVENHGMNKICEL